jgi:hypothetical protein
LAKHYAERNDVKFFIFDKPNTGFFKVDFDIIKEPPETITEDSDIDDEIHENIVRRLAHTVPSRYKQRIPNSVNAFLKSSYRAARRVKNYRLSHKEHTQLKLVLSKQAIFTQSDVVLIFGSPWANPAMMPALINAKLQKGFKVVQVIYDLIPVLMPYLFGEALLPEFTRYLFDVVTNSDGLVAISKSSKKDVEAFCDRLLVSKKPVGVIRLGDEFVKSIPKMPAIDLQPGEFVLCVGTFEIRKNHQLLYYAYKEAKQRGIKLPKLVIVGRRGWLTEDLAYVIHNDPDVNKQIVILRNTSDSHLSWLYENCRFTVYPALYEGWGLPIAEALSYGKVCIASNTSSMIEIAPDLVEHFSPYDSSACLELMQKYSEDNKSLREKELQIHDKYGKYSWRDTYKQFDAFIQDLIIK